ncbi:MAG: helix-turn-helix domain-containing protein [Proteobacteria bacterium]|nr:helix-turn-helix domain-containing protein [Pseudomonadota bacterium]
MFSEKTRVSSGISVLDRLLGGLFIGDNVIWYDDAGSLALAFCMNLIQTSQSQNKSIIYVSFDRSPKSLLDMLGPLAESKNLTILDCFTQGKGDGSEIFGKFYEKNGAQWPYQIIKVNEPWKPEKVMDAIYGIHKTMEGDVRFVIESLTGMQDLWGGEDTIRKFYSHSCPRLYDLNTIAYWIIEKGAHSNQLKAHINQIAQVAIDLSIQGDSSTLTILKAEGRNPATQNKPATFSKTGMTIEFADDKSSRKKINIGMRLKELRKKQGVTQADLAKLVGVTPSNISQIESNLISPSLSALLKIAEALFVDISYFFQSHSGIDSRLVFSSDEGITVKFTDLPAKSITGSLLTPMDFEPKAEPYLIEVPAKTKLPSHFFIHKGEEMGYMLSGKLSLTTGKATYTAKAGDVIYLKSEMPSQWVNPGPGNAKLLWIKIK